MPKHIVRLLVLILVVATVVFSAKKFLTPDTFYQYGHYRGNAVAEIASKEPKLQGWLFMAGLAMMAGVLAMRWNVVIGGQELSKTMKGLLTYYPEIFGRESLFTVLIISICPYFTLWLVTKLLPPWAEKIGPENRVFDVHKLA